MGYNKLLKKCKCGHTPMSNIYGTPEFGLVYIRCTNPKCKRTTALYDDLEPAINAWNSGAVVDYYVKEHKEEVCGVMH